MNNFEKIKLDVDIDKLTIDEAKKTMIEASYNGSPVNLSLYQIKQYLQEESEDNQREVKKRFINLNL